MGGVMEELTEEQKQDLIDAAIAHERAEKKRQRLIREREHLRSRLDREPLWGE